MAESGSGGSGDGRTSRSGFEPKHDPLADGAIPGNPRLKLGTRSTEDVLSDKVSSGDVERTDAIRAPTSFKGRHATSFFRLHESSSFRYVLEREGVDTAKLLQQVRRFDVLCFICFVVSSPRAV